MEELNTNNIMKAVGSEMEKLPHDKSLHFLGSYYLCLDSKAFDNEEVDSSISILKAVLDSFKVGVIKEFNDKGLSGEPAKKVFENLIQNLTELHKLYRDANLNIVKHETDLLADMIGLGVFMVNQSLRSLNWIGTDENNS